MVSSRIKLPIHTKLTSVVLGILALFYILYIGKDILIPLVFSVIIAILLNPVVNFLCRKKVNRTLAIIISVVAAIILILALTYFILSQAVLFSDSLHLFQQKFLMMLSEAVEWVSSSFNIDKSRIDNWILDIKEKGMSNSSNVLGTALVSIGGVVVLILLIPVYIFMMLYYKPLILEFISMLFISEKTNMIHEVLSETKSLIQSYIVGLLVETAIVATIYAIGLLFLDIQYAILIAVIGALLNLIPYIGGIVAVSMPLLIAVATKSPIYSLWVVVLFIVVQIIDNNYIVPKIVASKVKVNALVSIVVVLIGNALWGVAGMFLAIPLTAIVKVVFDRIPQLRAFGFLIGDNQPEIGKSLLKDIVKGAKSKF